MRHLTLLFLSFSFFLVSAFSAPVIAKGKKYNTVYIVAIVPEGTGDVYITGDAKAMGPWDPGRVKMYVDGNKRIYALEAKKGYELEYKFTLGSWENEAVNVNGTAHSNFRLKVFDKQVYAHQIAGFKGQ